MTKYVIYRFIFILTLGVKIKSDKFRFDNYTLYKILPKNIAQIKLLRQLERQYTNFDFWTDLGPSVDFVNVLSGPQDKDHLESFLKSNNLNFEITQSNIQEVLDKEFDGFDFHKKFAYSELSTYHELDHIYSWLDELALKHKSVTILSAGGSYENRDIKGIKISNGKNKRAIFIESGIHARERVAPSTACYIIYKLLNSDDPEIVAAANNYDWYIFPVCNPDGYVFTFTTYRMWRKNTRPQGDHDMGVDLNRNWDSHWMEKRASGDPASFSYAGPEAFSEPETRNLAKFIRTVGNDLDIYLSFHSHGQFLLIPFGNSTKPYANYYEALNIGRRAMGALSVKHGTLYTTGNIAEAIYEATGSSIDWVKDNFPVPLVYCYEFRDKGKFGFILPPEQIIPNSEEVLDSILELIHQGRRYGMLASSAQGVLDSFHLVIVMVFIRSFMS